MIIRHLHRFREQAAHLARLPLIDLMLDTNCAWLPDQVIDWVRALEPIGLKWLEEPVYPPDDFTTMARIRAHK